MHVGTDEQSRLRAPKITFGWRRRVRSVRQSESAECGLAAIAMILDFHGREVALKELRATSASSRGGHSLAHIIDIADQHGLRSRAVRLEVENIKRLATPCILHVDLCHFVVLKDVIRGKFYIADPAVGDVKLTMAQISRRFSGVALELTPSESFARRPRPPSISLRALTGKIVGLKREVASILALALVLETLALCIPLYVQTVLDKAVPTRDIDLLRIAAISFLALVGGQAVLSAMRSWALNSLGMRLGVAWSTNVFAHLMQVPDDFFQKRALGDVLSRFDSINQIRQTLASRGIESVLDGLVGAITIVVLFHYSAALAWITLGAIAAYIVLRAASLSTVQATSGDLIAATARQESVLVESIRSSHLFKLHNGVAARTSYFLNRATDCANKGAQVQSVELVFGSATTFVLGALRACVVGFGAMLVFRGSLTTGMLVAFLAYSEQFTARAARLIDFVAQLRVLRIHTQRLADIIETAPEAFQSSSQVLASGALDIRLRNVHFKYGPFDHPILESASLHIRAGESVAIVGASGAGKSTLVKLLCGLLEPSAGAIEIGGRDVRQLGKRALRNGVAVVLQEDSLLAGSIRENISFFDETSDLTRVVECSQIAGVHEEIMAMPMRYETLVGDMGSLLSGGQRQRICIARALFRNPRVLIMDESTSNLDVNAERLICLRLRELPTTRVVIAHRPETIASADRVFELREGRLIEASRQRSVLTTIGTGWSGKGEKHVVQQT